MFQQKDFQRSGLLPYPLVCGFSYLPLQALIIMVGYLSSNVIFSKIHAQNPGLLGLKWKLRTWRIQKCLYLVQQLLPNWSYKPPNVNGRFFWDTLYLFSNDNDYEKWYILKLTLVLIYKYQHLIRKKKGIQNR